MADIRAAASDYAYAARYYRRMVRERQWEKVLGDFPARLERSAPPLFRLGQALVGRREPGADPAPLPAWGSTVEMDGMTLRVDERMSPYNVRKVLAGRHTQHERALLKPILRPDDTVLELGGGIGTVAITCARIVGSERVHAYEANPEIESLVRDNYALNDVSPSLHVAMVGETAGTRTFYLGERFSRSSIYDCQEGDRTVEVPVEPLGEVMARVRPTVMVVDIQGGEAELVRYADFSGLRALLIELHPDITGMAEATRIRRVIRAAGLRERDGGGNSFLFVRPDSA